MWNEEYQWKIEQVAKENPPMDSIPQIFVKRKNYSWNVLSYVVFLCDKKKKKKWKNPLLLKVFKCIIPF